LDSPPALICDLPDSTRSIPVKIAAFLEMLAREGCASSPANLARVQPLLVHVCQQAARLQVLADSIDNCPAWSTTERLLLEVIQNRQLVRSFAKD
jgi:hypothetical protein